MSRPGSQASPVGSYCASEQLLVYDASVTATWLQESAESPGRRTWRRAVRPILQTRRRGECNGHANDSLEREHPGGQVHETGESRELRKRPKPLESARAMMISVFMILLDSTIVAIANPSIMAKLDTSYDMVVWVTSATVTDALPLLLAGQLGDRFGIKNLYLIGLAVFTTASVLCGLSRSIDMLIAARVVQGVGAALLAPQPLSAVTRIFSPERRGLALGVWGATAGRHPDRAVGRWSAGRHAGVGVDLFRQCPCRHRRAGASCPVDPGVAYPQTPVRPGRRWVVRTEHVPDRLRAAAGAGRRLGAVDLGNDRRGRRFPGGVCLVAVDQHPRAADPTKDLR